MTRDDAEHSTPNRRTDHDEPTTRDPDEQRLSRGDKQTAPNEEQETATDGGAATQRRQTMGGIDHTPPVEGATRTFERGGESDRE